MVPIVLQSFGYVFRAVITQLVLSWDVVPFLFIQLMVDLRFHEPRKVLSVEVFTGFVILCCV